MWRKSDISRILKISGDTLRYFEDRHIITPEKNPVNQYRMYSEVDISRLIEYKRYRSFDYSQNEAKELLTDTSLKDMDQSFAAQRKKLQEKIRHYTNLEAYMAQYEEKRKELQADFGKPDIRAMEEHDCLQRCDHRTHTTRDDALIQAWMENAPFVDYYIRIPYKHVNDDSWQVSGLFCLPEWTEKTGLPVPEDVEKISSPRAVHAFCTVEQREDGLLMDVDSVNRFLKEHQLQVRGDLFGFKVADLGTEGGIITYLEVYLPIA